MRKKYVVLAIAVVSIVSAVFVGRAYAPITPALDDRTYQFNVEIDGVVVGGFKEVDGLSVEMEVIEYTDGNTGQTTKIPGRAKWSNIVLKRGVVGHDEITQWIMDTVKGENIRKSGSIIMYNQDGQEIVRYNFINAFPVKWTGPTLASGNIAIETIEIAHEGLTIQ